MKKRLLIIDGPLCGGGAERVLIDILRNIDYGRYEVDLAVICRGGVLMDEVPEQVNVIELWPGYTFAYKLALRMSLWLKNNFLFSRKMNGSKLRRDYDLEISFLEGMPTKLGALRTTGAKKAAWVHVDLDRYRYEASQFYPGEEARAYDTMDYVVNVSKDCEDAFRRRFPNCKSALRTIYNPIDRKKIAEFAGEKNTEDKSCMTVAMLGRVTAQKNPQRFIDVASLSKEANLNIVFKWIGDGPLRSEMEDECRAKGLEKIVTFTGFQKNPFPMLSRADVLMVTSDFEGFCLAIPEAMCLGVPVISTRTAGPSEIIGDNEYGVLTDFSAEAMFEALKRLYDNPELRKGIADKALSRPDEYSVEKTVTSIYDLISENA